jgi:hypothetical protein
VDALPHVSMVVEVRLRILISKRTPTVGDGALLHRAFIT